VVCACVCGVCVRVSVDICRNATYRVNTVGMTHIKIKKLHGAGMAFRALYVVNICVCVCVCVLLKTELHKIHLM
jgi:hypothetical protein